MLKVRFYSFSGKDENDQSIHGIIDAPNKAFAHYMLLKIGLKKIYYLSITLSSYQKIFSMSAKEKLNLFSQLNLQINAGISILDGINSLKFDANSFKCKYILFSILKNLNDGYSLSVSLEKLPYSPFSATEFGLIKSAEASGTLDTIFEFICTKLKSSLHIKEKITSALIYPCITLFISFVVIFIIFKWIIPQFAIIFLHNKHPLPWMTALVFSLSQNIDLAFFTLLLTIALLYTILRLLVKYGIFSAKFKEQCVLKIPIAGKITIMTNRINFCYTLFMLLGAGISIYDALTITHQNITLPYSKYRLQQALKELANGKNLSTVLKNSQFFPRSAIQTITVAESSGRLDQAFKIISQQFSHDLSIFSDHVSKIIEPFIIILLGSIIAVIVVAIYLPIFQLGSLY